MRTIHEGDIRFVGEDLQLHGAARRMIERLARQSRKRGHAVSEDQVARGLVLGMQQGVKVQANIVRAVDSLRRLVEKAKR